MKTVIYAASERSKTELVKKLGIKPDDVGYVCKDQISASVIQFAVDNNIKIVTEDWMFEDYNGMPMLEWCEVNNVNPAQLSNNVYLIKDIAVVYDGDDIKGVIVK